MKCQYCGKKAELVPGSVIYPHIPALWNHMYYHCEPCEAYVGVHKGTRNAFGTLANKELRGLRIKAHNAFDPLWKNGSMTRDAAYGWLAIEMKVGFCHIGVFGPEQCKQVVKLVDKLKEVKNV